MPYTDADRDLLDKYNFAEAGNQKPQVWAANAQAVENRLKSGKYGSTVTEVIQGMSSAIRTNSKQWQIASGQKSMNDFEKNVMKKITATDSAFVRGNLPNEIGGATHFENIKKFGIPKWAKGMIKTATIGEHTYYAPK